MAHPPEGEPAPYRGIGDMVSTKEISEQSKNAYSIEELSSLLDQISWGHRIVEISTSSAGYTFAFRPLKLQERNAAQHVYDRALEVGAHEGIPLRKDLLLLANRSGLWNAACDQEIEMLNKELAAREDELSAAKFKSKKVKLSRRIEYIRQALNKLTGSKIRLLDLPSLEYYANQQRAHYILHKVTLTFPALEPQWPTFADMQNELDTAIVFHLINSYYNYTIVDSVKIRALARSGVWRVKWNAAKTCGNLQQLFNVDLSDLTVDQHMLIYWSQVYDSVYEAYERPPDYIIEDDDELDKWLEKEGEEREKERRKSFKEKKSNLGLGKTKSIDANEVLIPVNGYYSDVCTCEAKNTRGMLHKKGCPYGVFFYYQEEQKRQEAEQVQECNAEGIRLILAKEKEVIRQQGEIREEHLRTKNSPARNMMGFTTSIRKRE
jgi:hypothetical protein